ncbi:MAG: DUF1003 domain-containing protein [Pyrinomonadaceae bacterium]
MARKKKEKAKGIDKEIASNVSEIVELEDAQRKKRTVAEQLSEVIAKFCGSMTFVYVHIVWFGSWIIFNDFTSLAFDPFPYTFLTLVVSLEAIFLSTFILISQNHDTQLSERRNHLDLQINLLAEQENTKMLELLQAIAGKVGVTRDPEVDTLLEPIDPKKLVKQIVRASGVEERNGAKKVEQTGK